MTRPMLVAFVWMEWRQVRAKWIALLVLLTLPSLTATTVQAGIGAFASLADWEVERFLRGGLGEHAGFLGSIGMILVVVFAASGVAMELSSREIFFLLELPLRRGEVFAAKFLSGAAQVLVTIAISFLVLVAWGYALLLLFAPHVSFEGTWRELMPAWGLVVRASAWTGSIALVVYAATLCISLWTGRWWAAALTATAFYVAAMVATGGRMLDWVDAVKDVYRDVGLALPAALIVPALALYLIAHRMFLRKEMR